MKKYLILLIIPLLFFSIGCEGDENLEEVTDTIIDQNLIGVWKLIETNSGYDYFRSFSSNGKWGYWIENLMYENGQYISVSNFLDQETGDYWVEDDYIIFNYSNSSIDDVSYYNVSGNTLTLNQGNWEKQ